MRERILIRNADAVVTCDPADRVLYNSDILICGGRIEAVGSNLAAGDAQIIDAAGKYVYPVFPSVTALNMCRMPDKGSGSASGI